MKHSLVMESALWRKILQCLLLSKYVNKNLRLSLNPKLKI